MSTFVFDQAGFTSFLTDTNNALARTLEDTAEAIAVSAQENVGTQIMRFAPNPAPGPPYRRTGDLQASIRATSVIVFGPTMEANVICDATNRGFPYPIWLRINGYEFVNLASFEV